MYPFFYSTTPENPMFFKTGDEWRVEPFRLRYITSADKSKHLAPVNQKTKVK